MKYWHVGTIFLISIILIYCGWSVFSKPEDSLKSSQSAQHAEVPVHKTGTPDLKKEQSQFPDYVLEVLDYVRAHGKAPEGYVGGRTFQNREKRLSSFDTNGMPLQYREWDVHPKVPGKNRGAERLITGSDESAWYTNDHYKSFKRILP